MTLHVTNGDVAAGKIAAAGVPGDVLPWRDILHDGPVPPDDDRAAFRAVRAAHLAAAGHGSEAAILADMAARDARLERAAGPIVLWFEADLYDQLQLLQVLTRLSGRADVSLICIGAHPDHPRFIGLGQLGTDELAALYPTRMPVDAAIVSAAAAGWRAFTGADPTLWPLEDDGALPFLGAALRRLAQEFPWTSDGFGLTERRLLDALRAGPADGAALFRAVQDAEACPFLGDTPCWLMLAALVRDGFVAHDGAVRLPARTYWLPPVMPKRYPPVRRIGGADATVWRWSEAVRRLVAYP